MENAIRLDVAKRYDEAVIAYENAISTPFAFMTEAYINLAFLYFKFADDYLFNKEFGISDDLSIQGGVKCFDVLLKGRSVDPNNKEFLFWEKYFSYRLIGSEFTREQCEKIVKLSKQEKLLVPYFYLNLFDREVYRNEVSELLQQCEKILTAKNRYILTFVI